MAMFPCDVNNRRYNGAQQTMYPAIVHGGTAMRRKLRLCPVHFDAFVGTLEQNANNAQAELFDEQAVKCISCGNPVTDSTVAFFCTVYAAKSERQDWWAPCHEDCVAAAVEDWHIPT